MVTRSGSRRVDPGSPLVDLDLVFADDALVDALTRAVPDSGHRSGADGRPARHRIVDDSPVGACPIDGAPRQVGVVDRDPLMDLFRSWRAELTAPPLPPAPDVRRVMSAGAGGSGKRSLRSVLAVAAAIAALLVGSATLGSRHATPDSALWAVTQVLWPRHAESVTSSQHVQQALHQAQAALATGRTQDAQLALLRAASELGKVDEGDGRLDMQAQVDELWRAAAPQQLSGTSLAPDLLAGGPVGSVASPVSAPPSTAQGTDRTSPRSSKPGTQPSTAPGAPLPISQAGARSSGPAAGTAGNQADAGSSPVGAGSVTGGTGPLLQQPVAAAPPGDPDVPQAVSTSPVTTPPVTTPPVTAPPVVSNPAGPPVAGQPIVPDPLAPATADDPATVVPSPPAVMTPPAPIAADPPPPSVPDTTTSAPPAPAPAPQPTGSDTGTADSVPDAGGNGATELSTTDTSTLAAITADATPTT